MIYSKGQIAIRFDPKKDTLKCEACGKKFAAGVGGLVAWGIVVIRAICWGCWNEIEAGEG